MAEIVVTLRIMPASPEIDLTTLKSQIIKHISDFGGEVGKEEIEPIGFGLKALKLFFVMDEKKGATDPLEEKIKTVEGVQSVEVIDVRRTLG